MIGNNHGSSDMVVDGKSYTVGKSPTQPNISINLGIAGDQRTAGFEAGIPMVIFRFAVAC
jgi:hypothetical protein